jgi:protein-disulfide isomerase
MQTFHKVLAAGGVVGVAVIGWQMTRKPPVSIPANVTITAADTAGFRGYVMGSDSAPVTIVEYADFQCPQCENFDAVQWPSVYEQLVATGKLRWVYRDYPLDQIHPYTRLASHAAACADEQGKFWQMKQKLYNYQASWSFGTGQMGKFREYAKAAGVDADQWQGCMESAKYAGRIQASYEEGSRLGVNSTPSFLVGGRIYPGVQGSDAIRRTVDSMIAAMPKAPAAR